MVARGIRPAERGIGAAVLRLLLAPAFARNLHIGTAECRVPSADGNRHVGGQRSLDPLAGDVVMETRRSPLAGGVVEHLTVGDRRKRRARINGERLPGL